MLQPLYYLLLCLLRSSVSESLSPTTIIPGGAERPQESWTVSVNLPNSTTLEVDIGPDVSELSAITLSGPTTLVSVIRINSVISPESGGDTGSSSGLPSTASNAIASSQSGDAASLPLSTGSVLSNVQSGASQAASPLPITTSTSTRSGVTAGLNLLSTQSQAAFSYPSQAALSYQENLDPDSRMGPVINHPKYVPPTIPSNVCVLWDSSCKGNKTLAADEFFGYGQSDPTDSTMFNLKQDPCFSDSLLPDIRGLNCTTSLLNPADASLTAAVKSYMRQPQCAADGANYTFDGRMTAGCCQTCNIYSPNVEVYYWPDANVNTSCLDIIGSSTAGLYQGAQTDSEGLIYWDATITDTALDLELTSQMIAVMTTINGVTVKKALYNPWDVSPSTTTTRPVPTPNTGNPGPLSLHPRAYRPLYMREQLRLNDSEVMGGLTNIGTSKIAASTAVLDGFTFTSPSIYVAFHSLSASDSCGYVGKTYVSTMLTFAPGELSTVQGPLYSLGVEDFSTNVFNFADLPCPPYSVMYDDWYKPAPGDPYRPLIALPSKVRSIDPWWNTCTDAFYFTGYDPPRSLIAATEMVNPAMTAVDPGVTASPAQHIPPLPSDTGATLKPTTVSGDPTSDGAQVPPSIPMPSNWDPSTVGGSPSTATINGIDPQQGAGVKANTHSAAVPPAAGPRATTSLSKEAATTQIGSSQPIADPESMAPAQLSQLHQVLQTDPSDPSSSQFLPGAFIFNFGPQTGTADVVPTSDVAGNERLSQTAGPVSFLHVQPSGTSSNPMTTQFSDNDTPVQGGDLDSNQQLVSATAAYVSGPGLFEPLPQDPTRVVIGGSIIDPDPPTGQPSSAVAGTEGVANGMLGAVSTSLPADNAWSGNSLGSASNPQYAIDPVTTLAGQAVQVIGPSAIAINGHTIKQGAPLTTVSSVPIVFEASALIIGSSTMLPPSPTQTPAPVVLKVPGGQTLTQVADNPNAYVIAGSEVALGSSGVVVNGMSYSLASPNLLLAGTSTINIATAGANLGGNGALRAGLQAFTPVEGGSAVAIDGSTLSINGAAITNQGTTISLAAAGLVVGTSTYAFAAPAPEASATSQTTSNTMTSNALGQTYISQPPDSASGSGMTLGGTSISLDSSGHVTVGSNTNLSADTNTAATSSPAHRSPGSAVRPVIRMEGPALVMALGLLALWELA